MMFSFHVPGRPIPKARARVSSGHAYTPARTVIYEAHVRRCAVEALPWAWGVGGRYSLTLEIAMPDRRRTDCSNVLKSIEDALNGVAWVDDSQIDELHITRSVDKSSPGVRVCVTILEGK